MMVANYLPQKQLRRKLMNWLKTNNFATLKKTVCSVALLLAISAVPMCGAQAMQKGISVKMAPASSAVPMPDADNDDALIVTVTENGKLYLGIDAVAPDSLAGRLKDRASRRTVYIKADAKAPYAAVVKVLDAARTAEVDDVILLTTQPRTTSAGAIVLPQGIAIKLSRHLPVAAR
jgi:biopolymer transport protein ExbD/biopolymer transport protein TolR